MRSLPRLGAVNAALISIYFAPVWGMDALRALTSPVYGLQDRAHVVAAGYYRALFDFGVEGMVRTSYLLSGLKFVVAIGFFAYLIDFARAFVVGRQPNRETLDAVLALAGVIDRVLGMARARQWRRRPHPPACGPISAADRRGDRDCVERRIARGRRGRGGRGAHAGSRRRERRANPRRRLAGLTAPTG